MSLKSFMSWQVLNCQTQPVKREVENWGWSDDVSVRRASVSAVNAATSSVFLDSRRCRATVSLSPNWRRQRGRETAARRRRRLHFWACFMALLLREGSSLPLSCQSETLAAAGYSKKTNVAVITEWLFLFFAPAENKQSTGLKHRVWWDKGNKNA